MDFEQIKTALIAASPDQRRKVRLLLDHLDRETSTALLGFERTLYTAIIRCLRDRHVPYLPIGEEEAYKPRARGFDLTQFREGCDAVLTWMSDHQLSVSGPNEVRFATFVATAVVGDLLRRDEPISLKSIQTALLTWPEIVDAELPGYAGAGLLDVLLR